METPFHSQLLSMVQDSNNSDPAGLPLAGQRAAVTGASGGIGGAIALALARDGADVLLHAHQNRSEADSIAEKIEQLGRRATVVTADISDPQEREELVTQAWQWQQGIDTWINAAGVDVLTGEASSLSFEQKLQQLWQVDVQGTILLCRLVGQRMKNAGSEPGEAVLLNIGWDQVAHGMEGESGEMFGAIKGAITAFTLSLARSLAPVVRVNCIAPGWIRTAWGEKASEAWQQRAISESLLGRWGTPEDVANVACFLASPAANFLSGQVIPVNGGFRHAGNWPGEPGS
ncbi:MAG: SDR family oxidoreductase [Pirellulaceae bacterium]